jgi:hypothetical protein
MSFPNNGSHDELDRLFAEYRESCPVPEVGAGFMPGIWRRIDGRRGFSFSIGRLSRRYVTAAAALCLLMAVLLAMPQLQGGGPLATTYVEALATDHSPDNLAFAEIVHHDEGVE